MKKVFVWVIASLFAFAAMAGTPEKTEQKDNAVPVKKEWKKTAKKGEFRRVHRHHHAQAKTHCAHAEKLSCTRAQHQAHCAMRAEKSNCAKGEKSTCPHGQKAVETQKAEEKE